MRRRPSPSLDSNGQSGYYCPRHRDLPSPPTCPSAPVRLNTNYSHQSSSDTNLFITLNLTSPTNRSNLPTGSPERVWKNVLQNLKNRGNASQQEDGEGNQSSAPHRTRHPFQQHPSSLIIVIFTRPPNSSRFLGDASPSDLRSPHPFYEIYGIYDYSPSQAWIFHHLQFTFRFRGSGRVGGGYNKQPSATFGSSLDTLSSSLPFPSPARSPSCASHFLLSVPPRGAMGRSLLSHPHTIRFFRQNLRLSTPGRAGGRNSKQSLPAPPKTPPRC